MEINTTSIIGLKLSHKKIQSEAGWGKQSNQIKSIISQKNCFRISLLYLSQSSCLEEYMVHAPYLGVWNIGGIS